MPPRGGDAAAAAAPAPALPSAAASGRGGLLADIRGGARLKKVSDAEKRDRSAAAIPGSESAAPAASGGKAGESSSDAAAGGGLAGALASALAARKSKVSHSGTLILFIFPGCVLLLLR
jgi:Wiskott-Aldrich syndrome protein